jgi:hypothetical protein
MRDLSCIKVKYATFDLSVLRNNLNKPKRTLLIVHLHANGN